MYFSAAVGMDKYLCFCHWWVTVCSLPTIYVPDPVTGALVWNDLVTWIKCKKTFVIVSFNIYALFINIDSNMN